MTFTVGQVTNEEKSVRGLVPFFSWTSVIHRQYTRCTLSVSVYTAKHNLKIDNRSPRGSYGVTTTSLFTLAMLIEVFQIDTDKPPPPTTRRVSIFHLMTYIRAAAYTL